MQYNPDDAKSEFEPCPLGTWPFSVAQADDKRSQNGNEMIALVMTVYVEGDEYTIKDFLVNTPKALFKTKQFCNSVGLDFARGSLSAFECKNKTGYLMVKHEGRDYEGKHYVDAKVDEYVAQQEAAAAGHKPPTFDSHDGDGPQF